jgi:beta-glucosidase
MNSTHASVGVLGALILAAASTVTGAAPPKKKLSAYDAEAKALLGTMTLEEKIGQMVQAEQDQVKEGDVAAYFLGSLLSGGNSDPKTNSLQDWTDLYDRVQSQTQKTRLKIPLLYGIDAVHGHNNVIGAVIFPHHIGLGATRDAALVEEVERITAQEVRATGIHWVFAPCVAVSRDERWGRSYESFSEDPALVAELARAAVRGFQGDDLTDPLRVLACAKHYVGDGGTVYGSGTVALETDKTKHWPMDQGDTRLSEADLRRIHMAGYKTAIEEGVGSIMPSYSSWNGERMSGHKHLLTDVLKDEMGFEGFLISDYNAIDALPGQLPRADQGLHQRGHGHVHGAQPLEGALRPPQGPGREGRGPDVAHRRRGPADPAGEIRDGPHGPQALRAGRPLAAEELRLRGAPGGGPACRAPVDGAAEE